MRLRQLRQVHGLKSTDISQFIGIDVPAYSKIETGKVLPTPETLKLICEKLKVNPLDIYDKKEIDLINCMCRNRSVQAIERDGRYNIRKVQFRRNDTACKYLQKEMLNKLGYQTAQSWFDECIYELKKRFE